MADVIETGVPGLDVVRAEPGAPWRLVHRPTGVLLSRVAVHSNPQPLVRLARLLGPLTDWGRAELTVAGPVLRNAIEEGAAKAGLPLHAAGDGHSSSGAPLDDRELLLRVLRRVHVAVAPGSFAAAIADLGPEERSRLRAMLTDEPSTTGAVVRPLSSPASRPGAEEPRGPSRSGSAAG
jgi:hypothetical protein